MTDRQRGNSRERVQVSQIDRCWSLCVTWQLDTGQCGRTRQVLVV